MSIDRHAIAVFESVTSLPPDNQQLVANFYVQISAPDKAVELKPNQFVHINKTSGAEEIREKIRQSVAKYCDIFVPNINIVGI